MDFALPANMCANCQHHLYRNKSAEKKHAIYAMEPKDMVDFSIRHFTQALQEVPQDVAKRLRCLFGEGMCRFCISGSVFQLWRVLFSLRDAQLENVSPRFTKAFDSIPKLDYKSVFFPCLRTCLTFGIIQKHPKTALPCLLVNISDHPRFFAQHLEVISRYPMARAIPTEVAFFLHGSKSMARTQGPLQMPRPVLLSCCIPVV